MALNINQFAQTPVQGEMDLSFGGQAITCQVDAAQATPLVAGQAVKLATTAGGAPKVLALTANTDKIFGFVARNIKDQSDPALFNCEVAMDNAVMYMTAGAAITRGSNVEVVFSGNTVITSAGINPAFGIALDTAVNNGDLIRVLIQAPLLAPAVGVTQTAVITATLAQINAGLNLIPGAAGKKITVSSYIARVNGASFAGGTNVLIQSNNASPVIVSTIAEAGLTSGAVLTPNSANTTLGAGFGAQLGTGDGLNVASTGTQTTATGITFTITYQQA